MYQRIQKSSSNTPTQDQSSKSSQHSLTIQAQQTSPEFFTQEEIENEAFNQSKFEASRLQLKKDGGIITPVEQERLDVLQAKMDDFWIQRRAKGSQFSYSLESILGRVPENPVSNNVQLKLAIQPHRSDVSPQSPKNRGIDFQRGDAQNHQIPPLQTKLTIGQPNDKYEQEADRVALQVVQQINSPVNTKSIQEQSVKRQTEEEEIQAKSEITSILRQGVTTEEKASTELESAINSARGSGQPLAPNLQQSMGQAMKVDFSGVRVHTDAKSDQLNQSIQARAFTTGQDVFFRQGEYQPGSRSGQELIAHELTHVVQQNGEAVKRSPLPPQQLSPHPATETPSASASDLPLQAKGEKTGNRPDSSVEQRPNKMGMPDALKAGVESLSGYSLDDVRVHYNSPKPAQLQALAYTQGTEIHVASGQEEHLSHEAWHVVQQMQGRVKPTMQMKVVQINDDEELEREADVMGRRTEKISRKGEKSSDQSLHRHSLNKTFLKPIQRKIAYKNPDQWMIHKIKVTLKEKFLAKKATLFNKEDQGIIDTLFNEEYYGKLFNALKRLSYSKYDYGTFDLDKDQHLALLFYELKKHLNTPQADNEIAQSEEQARVKNQESEEYFQNSPNPGLTFELALLGAGAATAYYLTSAGNSIDKYKTIVIGPTQPWAGDRGPGVINHPLHMINAIREEVGLGEEQLAPREEFSKIVETVIDKYVIHRRPYKVNKVTKVDGKNGEKFYQIEVENGVKFYARKVVAGLGIGPHKVPENKNNWKQEALKDRRAIDMDEFQNRAEAIKKTKENPADITVVVGGGNAGIDSVMTSIRCGFTIIWVTGSQRPALLPGTDNEFVEEEYEKVTNKQGSKINEVIKDYANGAKENENKEGKPIIVTTGQGDRPADYFVYALGPDIDKIKNVFDKDTIRDKLVPTYDKNRQFGAEGLSTVVGLEVAKENEDDKTSLEIIGGTAFRMAGDINYDYMLRMSDNLNHMVDKTGVLFKRLEEITSNIEEFKTIKDLMNIYYKEVGEYKIKTTTEVNQVQRAQKSEEVPKSLEKPPSSDKIEEELASTIKRLDPKQHKDLINILVSLSGCIRFVRNYYMTLQKFYGDVKSYLQKKAEARDKPFRDIDPRKAAAHTQGVIDSLPLNVAVGDQLTPIRSQEEANAGFVPDYVLDDVNFATDSNTVIAIYIAANYPYMSATQIDEWVDRIIRWRRPSKEEREKYTSLWGPLPNPRNKPRENATSFSDWFKKRLGEENEKAKGNLD